MEYQVTPIQVQVVIPVIQEEEVKPRMIFWVSILPEVQLKF